MSRDPLNNSWKYWGVPLTPETTQRAYWGILWPHKQTRGGEAKANAISRHATLSVAAQPTAWPPLWRRWHNHGSWPIGVGKGRGEASGHCMWARRDEPGYHGPGRTSGGYPYKGLITKLRHPSARIPASEIHGLCLSCRWVRVCTVTAGPLRPQPMGIGHNQLYMGSIVGFQVVRLPSLGGGGTLSCAYMNYCILGRRSRGGAQDGLQVLMIHTTRI